MSNAGLKLFYPEVFGDRDLTEGAAGDAALALTPVPALGSARSTAKLSSKNRAEDVARKQGLTDEGLEVEVRLTESGSHWT